MLPRLQLFCQNADSMPTRSNKKVTFAMFCRAMGVSNSDQRRRNKLELPKIRKRSYSLGLPKWSIMQSASDTGKKLV